MKIFSTSSEDGKCPRKATDLVGRESQDPPGGGGGAEQQPGHPKITSMGCARLRVQPWRPLHWTPQLWFAPPPRWGTYFFLEEVKTEITSG